MAGAPEPPWEGLVNRARCAVPFCRRTAPTGDGYVDQGFLCGSHWRLRTPAMKAEWIAHNALCRRYPDAFWKHPPGSEGRIVRLALERDHVALWERTKAHCIEVAMGATA